MSVLTVSNVTDIFNRYWLHPSDSSECIVDGLYGVVKFNSKITEAREFIHDMLAELPDEFGTEAGGDFRAARTSRWTHIDDDVEMLVQIGVAVSEAEFCLPRSEWRGYPRFRRVERRR